VLTTIRDLNLPLLSVGLAALAITALQQED
jgi:hypothetical protein